MPIGITWFNVTWHQGQVVIRQNRCCHPKTGFQLFRVWVNQSLFRTKKFMKRKNDKLKIKPRLKLCLARLYRSWNLEAFELQRVMKLSFVFVVLLLLCNKSKPLLHYDYSALDTCLGMHLTFHTCETTFSKSEGAWWGRLCYNQQCY